MLRIRLARTGKKRQPSYRIVVADKRSRRDGRVVERIGFYNPLPDPAEYRIKEERALHWLSIGAQPTDTVRRLLEKQGTLGRLERIHAGEDMATLMAEYEGVDPLAMAQVDALEVESAVTDEEE
jgi:small subunit ribosomal protein S16